MTSAGMKRVKINDEGFEEFASVLLADHPSPPLKSPLAVEPWGAG